MIMDKHSLIWLTVCGALSAYLIYEALWFHPDSPLAKLITFIAEGR